MSVMIDLTRSSSAKGVRPTGLLCSNFYDVPCLTQDRLALVEAMRGMSKEFEAYGVVALSSVVAAY